MPELISTDSEETLYTESEQVTLLTCHLYQTPYQKWQGFRNMGLAPRLFKETPGLLFSKMLGSGGGGGFSVWPHWGRYFSLTVWSHREFADDFLDLSSQCEAMLRLRRHQSTEWSLFLKPFMAHGQWDRRSPFVANQINKPQPEQAVAILTRARIKGSKLYRFWRDVPRVSQSMEGVSGCVFAAGVGELPLIQQATISVWESEAAMKNFAYSSADHKAVIKRTRQVGWYSEELFARFKILGSAGVLPVHLKSLVESPHQKRMNLAS
jgi:heme-degrading monooxygenase HmoA